jgi:uncharacterized protein
MVFQIFRLSRKTKKYLWQSALAIFLILNILSFAIAYFATHFSGSGSLGASRPIDLKTPSNINLDYIPQKITINEKEWLETWFIPTENVSAKGTVIMFPGNHDSKGKHLLAPARAFHDLQYNTLLVDYRGVGGSSGNETTLGFKEARDVALAWKYAQQAKLQQPYILHGTSMGSAAVLTAVAKENVKPDGIILELPFARSIDAVRSRVGRFHIPNFPITELIIFWGGIQHGFNAFSHNPVTYASQVECPTLILQGATDPWTKMAEVNEILQNLQGRKNLVVFPNTGHTVLVTVDKELWKSNVNKFLQAIQK